MLLAFDTETTGLVDFRMPSDHPSQPHLVQLAAVLIDEETWQERASLSVIIEPEGWQIPEAASAVHGIDTETAKRCGVPLSAAIWPFICLRSQARLTVSHDGGLTCPTK
jgi:DNA polymerase-3 subunit epsilon